MPQAIEVEGQAEQQGLTDLQRHAAARCFRRQLAFDHREDRLDLRPVSIQLTRERSVHLVPDFSFRVAPTARSGDHTVGPQSLRNVAVILLGVELGVGQHQADRQGAAGHIQQSGKSARVAPRTLPRTAARPRRPDPYRSQL